jgi:hypothetical protein
MKMAFGVTREQLLRWKEAVSRGEIAFLTHYWLDARYPGVRTVTKVGCSDLSRLAAWCEANGLPSQYIHRWSLSPLRSDRSEAGGNFAARTDVGRAETVPHAAVKPFAAGSFSRRTAKKG